MTDPYTAPSIDRTARPAPDRVSVATGLSAWGGLALALYVLVTDRGFRGAMSFGGPDDEAHLDHALWRVNVLEPLPLYVLLVIGSSLAVAVVLRASLERVVAKRALPVDFRSTALAVLVILAVLGRFVVRVVQHA